MDLPLNSLQRFLWHKTPTTKPNHHLHKRVLTHILFCVRFRTNTLVNGINPRISPSYGLNTTTAVFYKNCFGIK